MHIICRDLSILTITIDIFCNKYTTNDSLITCLVLSKPLETPKRKSLIGGVDLIEDNMKVAIIYDNLGPYHYARVRALSRLLSDLLVVEVASSSITYAWLSQKVEKTWIQETLFLGKKMHAVPVKEIKQSIWHILERHRPEVVFVAGYRDAAMQSAAKWARKHGTRVILMLDSWREDKRRWWMKEKIKRWLVQRWFDAAFVGGWRHYLYAQSLGFLPERIWRVVDVVDNEYFSQGAVKARTEARGWRKRLELPEHYFICVARHSPEKNLQRLLQAYQLYRDRKGEWSLILVGDGLQRKELERQVRANSLNTVKFSGWVQYDLLPLYYGLAGALILPSVSEPWGLVVNEGMAAGLPVLLSRKCGCQPELCWRGINGLDFNPWDVDEMADVMLQTSSNISRCEAMGLASKKIIGNFSPEHWALVFLQCLRKKGMNEIA